MGVTSRGGSLPGQTPLAADAACHKGPTTLNLRRLSRRLAAV